MFIDQECEKYINKNGLTEKVEKKILKIYESKGVKKPTYQGDLPEGNNGLGLFLLGVTGDEVLPYDIYNKIKIETLKKVRGTVQLIYLKKISPKHLYLFDGIRFKNDGRCSGVFHRK